MCFCERMIVPNEKLTHMLFMFKIIFGINIALLIGKTIFWIAAGIQLELFTSLICGLILLGALMSLFFGYLMMAIFFILFRVITCLITLATLVQRVIVAKEITLTSLDFWVIGIVTFEMCFLIFALFICFPIYKEMKAISQENSSGRSNYRAPDVENQAQPQSHASSNNNSNFRAFVGQGIAVGGN